jgi:hypothetical protein
MKQPKSIEVKREERKKQTAEVFTPEWLAQQMLDKIPEDFWNNPDKTMLEPSCGDGIFVELAIKKRLKYNQPIEKIIKNTYAIDIMPDNIAICRAKVLQIILEELKKTFWVNVKQNKTKPNFIAQSKNLNKILVELTAIVWYNVRKTKDTLKEDFEKWKTFDELNEKQKNKYLSEAKKHLTQNGFTIAI